MPLKTWSRSAAPAEPAHPGHKVIDPAGWLTADLAESETWIYQLCPAEVAELDAAVMGVEARGLDIKDIRAGDFPLPTLALALSDVRAEILEGRGFAVIRGLPVTHYTPAQSAAAFWGIGTHLGTAVSQNAEGHLLGHVKDLGKDYNDPQVRGYQTHAQMGYHADPCDIVALLCLQPAKSGGASRIVSSVALYNEMLKRRPDLAEELTWKFYWTRHGEVPPGRDPWYRQAVFTFQGGRLTVRGASSHLMKAQQLPGVPAITPGQADGVKLFRSLAAEMAMSMDFQHGDMQFLNNHVTLHTRTEYEDWPEPERKRHLFRLWLSVPGARPLPQEFAEQMEGIRVEGARLQTPLDAE